MRARVRKDSGGMWIGEVYGTWQNWLLNTEWTGWDKVTSRCLTSIGARWELNQWKKEHCPDEFNL